jgi:DNA polymerase-1
MKKKHFSTRQPLLFPESDVQPSPAASMTPPASFSEKQAPEQQAIVATEPPIAPLAAPPKTDLEAGDLVIVVDSHSLIYQVFHALPPMTGPNGEEVGAVHGFLRDLADLRSKWQPDFLICAFDESEVTFRNQLYSEYKAHRDPMPEALRAQMPLIHQAVETLDIARLSMPGFEADDILATIAAEVEKVGGRCLLVTSDKDCRQLLSDRVQMLNIRKSEIYGVEELQKTWGIEPHQVVDFQAMVGDTSDNVPGVPQIGPKAAQQLLAEFGSLDEILNNIDRVAGAKRQETLRTHRESAILSEQLVRLRRDVPIPWNWRAWGNPQPDSEQVESMFRAFGIRRLAERFVVAHVSSTNEPVGETLDRSKYRCAVVDREVAPASIPSTEPRPILQETETLRPVWTPFESLKREIIEHFQKTPEGDRWLAIDTETTSLSARDAEPVGYSIAWSLGQAAYLPVRGPQPNRLLEHADTKSFLKQLLEDPTIQKIGQNIKYDLIVLRYDGRRLSSRTRWKEPQSGRIGQTSPWTRDDHHRHLDRKRQGSTLDGKRRCRSSRHLCGRRCRCPFPSAS